MHTMKALCWFGKEDVRVETVADPKILNSRDAIVRVTSTAICGSDLHLYGGFVPLLDEGDILGHEFMGEVVEVGREVRNVRPGDRAVVAAVIACGHCFFCQRDLWSLCDNSNPEAWIAEKLFGFATAGIYGYTHIMGGYAGGQAEYVRVPFADVGMLKIPDGLSDEQVLFLSDIFPTGYMAADHCDIQPGDIVAVWGCGPVGQFAIKSAYMLGAERVIAIDRLPERLHMAKEQGCAEPLNYEEVKILEALTELTGGRGPDACIDAVGLEAHVTSTVDSLYHRVKQAVWLETDRPHVLREAILACRKGGIVSVAGVYGGFIDKLPFGAAFNKGLTFKTGQVQVQKYMRPLLRRIEQGDIDPSFVITHRLPLAEAPRGYAMFQRKEEGCIKVVLKP
jgi:threonine dehydrogenase-like Zn-dependent dehydrogenase